MRSKELTTVASERLGDSAIQVEVTLPVRPCRYESLKGGQSDAATDAGSPPRIPRITRLMALAIKFQAMVDQREVRDYADLARLGYVTRARLTQIMNLLLLSPDIQEMLLFSTCDTTLSERRIRAAVKQVYWASQRAFLKHVN
jgi:hypothetical protein